MNLILHLNGSHSTHVSRSRAPSPIPFWNPPPRKIEMHGGGEARVDGPEAAPRGPGGRGGAAGRGWGEWVGGGWVE